MTIRRLDRQEVGTVLDWAAAEGWNPGLEDADAFFAADPEGYFGCFVGDRLVAAVSVVNHDSRFAFLGLYLCLPEYRGQGHGLRVWTAALAHAGNRCVGLDGVPEQQANYARSGFRNFGRTVRYMGRMPKSDESDLAQALSVSALVTADSNAAGINRERFSEAWFIDTSTRTTLCITPADPAAGFATFRQCREGVKIGPFYANSERDARRLLAGVPAGFDDGPVFFDVPDDAPGMGELVRSMGFEPVFETARMYSGDPPMTDLPPFYGIATLELG